MASAASTVFPIHELLEHILLNVAEAFKHVDRRRIKQLFLLSRVDHCFHATLSASSRLQHVMFLKALAAEQYRHTTLEDSVNHLLRHQSYGTKPFWVEWTLERDGWQDYDTPYLDCYINFHYCSHLLKLPDCGSWRTTVIAQSCCDLCVTMLIYAGKQECYAPWITGCFEISSKSTLGELLDVLLAFKATVYAGRKGEDTLDHEGDELLINGIDVEVVIVREVFE